MISMPRKTKQKKNKFPKIKKDLLIILHQKKQVEVDQAVLIVPAVRKSKNKSNNKMKIK